MNKKPQTTAIIQCPLCKRQLTQIESEVMKIYNFHLCVTCRAKQESKGGDKK